MLTTLANIFLISTIHKIQVTMKGMSYILITNVIQMRETLTTQDLSVKTKVNYSETKCRDLKKVKHARFNIKDFGGKETTDSIITTDPPHNKQFALQHVPVALYSSADQMYFTLVNLTYPAP